MLATQDEVGSLSARTDLMPTPPQEEEGLGTTSGDVPGGESKGLLKVLLPRLAGISVSVVFVYLAIRRADLQEFLRALGAVDLRWLLAAVLVYLSGFPIRSLRWRRILLEQKTLSAGDVMVPVVVGHMANNLLPARAGEVYRAHLLGRRAHLSRSAAVGSIVVERTFDGVMLVGAILLVFFLYPEADFLGGAALFIGFVFAALAAGILLHGFATPGTHRIVEWIVALMPHRLHKIVAQRLMLFLEGVRSVSTSGGYLKTGAYTVLIWALEATAISLVIISFGFALPLGGYLLVYALLTLGTTLPSGPGYIGPYQYAFVLALGFFAISKEEALAISVAAQAALSGSITVIGLVVLWREWLRNAEVVAQSRKGAS
jgi:glycosyltransferase 2 family protein